MRYISYLILLLFLGGSFNVALANKPEKEKERVSKNKDNKLRYRMDCAQATQQIDQEINNVRARLQNGGDVWWDRSDGRYVVPKVDPASGLPEVSSIFSGAVWLGGVDDAGNLKVACQTYGSSSGTTDFWPGPLEPNEGTVDAETCLDWDEFFRVYGEEIDVHLGIYNQVLTSGGDYDPDLIPTGVKGWPARGNPFFFEINGFELPNTSQGLGAFHDENGDGLYNPLDGDYPRIEIRGCEEPQYPDEMIFWIYNDAGGIHTQSNGQEIRMEVQVQAFAYETNDEINNMTFQRYKLINRAIESIDSTFFAMWVDPDLGCHFDDYVGCDTARSLAYVYNEDVFDGQTGCNCGDVNTYCAQVPILGVDYFRGPLNEFGDELGMSSFTYYNNASIGDPLPGTTDPGVAQEYYNYLSGSWRDGTPFSFGESGYDQNADASSYIDYAFTDPPNNNSGWSMCTADLPFGDRRTIQASGPFRLDPGAVNELIVGVVWVPEADYPCPDISALTAADELAQGLFDNCFELLEGPDAPDVCWIELDRELIAVLTNEPNTVTNNNAFEMYEEVDFTADKSIPEEDRTYRFEGYKIIQLNGPTVSREDFDNPDKARVVETVDVTNGVRNIFNWMPIPNPSVDPNAPKEIWVPEIQVENATDEGIEHTFRITKDLFAEQDQRLVNHKKYYFTVLAYGYNQYEEFSQDGGVLTGQRRPYLEGRKIGDPYVVIPRPLIDRKVNVEFGERPRVTRIDGRGSGGFFLDYTHDQREAFLSDEFVGRITYNPGQAPIDVKVYNPFELVEGNFRVEFKDEDMSNDRFDDNVTYRLINKDNNEVIESEMSIDRFNEQVFARYGFTIGLGQTLEAGDLTQADDGAVGGELEYIDSSGVQWFGFVPDANGGRAGSPDQLFNYVTTSFGEVDFDADPEQQLTNVANKIFVPYTLVNYRNDDEAYFTPAAISNNSSFVRTRNRIERLNNVDIVYTNDKSKWSRCVVIETTSPFIKNNLGVPTEGDAELFELRDAASVSKEDSNGDGLPDPDNSGTRGMGWFPGYAVDAETGQRLNIFFGEASAYNLNNAQSFQLEDAFLNPANGGKLLGNDMMWNPSSQLVLTGGINFTLFNWVTGGHHYVYVTNEEYDECENIRKGLQGSAQVRINTLAKIQWANIALLNSGTELLSYADGLIPAETVVKLRVDNPYDVYETEAKPNNGYPAYEFSTSGYAPEELTSDIEINEALDLVNVVPNPYYGYSAYETSQFTNTVKITNLPANCTVTIYTLDGKFIRQYNRNEVGIDRTQTLQNPGTITGQVTPAIEWDLKNNRNIPVASGTYLIHVDAPGLGERVIKWFGVARQFDPSGL